LNPDIHIARFKLSDVYAQVSQLARSKKEYYAHVDGAEVYPQIKVLLAHEEAAVRAKACNLLGAGLFMMIYILFSLFCSPFLVVFLLSSLFSRLCSSVAPFLSAFFSLFSLVFRLRSFFSAFFSPFQVAFVSKLLVFLSLLGCVASVLRRVGVRVVDCCLVIDNERPQSQEISAATRRIAIPPCCATRSCPGC